MAAEYISRHNVTGEAIADLWQTHAGRFTKSLGRIAEARQLLVGELRGALPEEIAKRPDGQAFRCDGPNKYVSVMQLVNMLANPAPRLRRPKTATSDRAEATASRIEKFVNPAVRNQLSHRDLTELLLVEAEAAAIVVPEVARFVKQVEYYAEPPKDGKPGKIDPFFARDEQGKSYDDHLDEAEGDEEKAKAAFKPNETRSNATYNAYVRHRRARNYPFDIELVSRQQCVPINPRVKGSDVEIDGLIVRTRMSATEALKRKYIIPGLTDHLQPTSDTEGDAESGELWWYQAWLEDYDDDGECYPYVAHSLAGKATAVDRAGFDKDAVIDLREQCGIRSLPVVYGYGWRWFTVNPDQRSMPYTFPFGRNWLAEDQLMSGKLYAAWSEGMLAWFLQMPDGMDVAQQQAWLEHVSKNPLTLRPFTVLPVWGKPVPAVHPGTGRDVNELIAALRGQNQAELVNPIARGGGEAGSAIERTTVKADTVAGVFDIRESARAMTAKIGEKVLEVCRGVEATTGFNVLVYGNPDAPVDNPSVGETRAIVELKSSWLGPKDQESFDLEAFYKPQLADNLAQNAQLFGFWQAGAITDEQWFDAIGVEDPDRYAAQLIFDRWKKTPQAAQVMMADAAKYLHDQELSALFAEQRQGAAGPGGEPFGMLAGLTPPSGPVGMPGGGPMPPDAQAAVGVQNPAASQAAAIVGAARNTDASAVTARGLPPAGLPAA